MIKKTIDKKTQEITQQNLQNMLDKQIWRSCLAANIDKMELQKALKLRMNTKSVLVHHLPSVEQP